MGVLQKHKEDRPVDTPSMYASGQYCYICSVEFTKIDEIVKFAGEYSVHKECPPWTIPKP